MNHGNRVCGYWTLWIGQDDQPWAAGLCHPGQAPQLTSIPAPCADDPPTIAAAVQAVLTQQGYAGQGLALAIPATWCLWASFSTAALVGHSRAAARRQAMLYQLEEYLPVAAEEVVADFQERSEQAMGLCVLVAKAQRLLEALEAAALPVQLLAPQMLLAAQAWNARQETPFTGVLVWAQEQTSAVEVVQLQAGQPVSWRWIVDDDRGSLLAQHLGRLALERSESLAVVAWNLSGPRQRTLAGMDGVSLKSPIEQSPQELATSLGPAVLSGQVDAWFNLRQGVLAPSDRLRMYRRPLQTAMACLLVFLVCLSIVCFGRAYRYRQLAGELESKQRALYHEVLPGQPLPASIALRLASEQRRLQGLHGLAHGGSETPGASGNSPSALVSLYELLRRLPAESRFRLLEVRLEGTSLYMEGQARSHAEAEALAAALRQQKGFAIEPPRTEQRGDKGVGFVISGAWPGASSSSPRNPATPSTLAEEAPLASSSPSQALASPPSAPDAALPPGASPPMPPAVAKRLPTAAPEPSIPTPAAAGGNPPSPRAHP